MIPSDLTAHPNLVAVALPGGGRAWVRRRLSVEQTMIRQAAKASLANVVPIDQLRGLASDGVELVAALVAAGHDPGEAIRAIGEMRIATVAACAWGWDGVSDPDGEPLTFPSDVRRMAAEDLDALYEAQEAAVERADPNAGRGPSSPPSRRAKRTPPGRSRSTSPGS